MLITPLGHGTDTGSPPAWLEIGVFPDGTSYDAVAATFSAPPSDRFTLRVDPAASAADVLALAQRTYAERIAAQAANAQALANLGPFIGQLLPAGGPLLSGAVRVGNATPPATAVGLPAG